MHFDSLSMGDKEPLLPETPKASYSNIILHVHESERPQIQIVNRDLQGPAPVMSPYFGIKHLGEDSPIFGKKELGNESPTSRPYAAVTQCTLCNEATHPLEQCWVKIKLDRLCPTEQIKEDALRAWRFII